MGVSRHRGTTNMISYWFPMKPIQQGNPHKKQIALQHQWTGGALCRFGSFSKWKIPLLVGTLKANRHETNHFTNPLLQTTRNPTILGDRILCREAPISVGIPAEGLEGGGVVPAAAAELTPQLALSTSWDLFHEKQEGAPVEGNRHELQSKPGIKMVDPEPCKEIHRQPQLFMAGIVPC